MVLTKIPGSLIEDSTITAADLADNSVTTVKIVDANVTTAKLTSGAAESAATGIKSDIALLAFKTQANGNLAKYNLIDQAVDSFEDASGINTSASTNEVRNSSSKYYSGVSAGATSITAKTATGVGTWTAPATGTAEILVVAGGGRGGKNHGGGGGAGGVVHATSYPVTGGVEYDLTVGAGYSADRGGNVSPSTGGDSSFNDNNEGGQSKMTALGGGSGGGASYTMVSNGGSGGGAGGHASPGGTGTATQPASPAGGGTGYGNGGGAQDVNSMGSGSGGGGADTAGEANKANGSPGGYGGAGKLFSTFVAYGTTSGNVASSGSDGGYFGGGGGGGRSTNAPAVGGVAGVGGGGAGSSTDAGQGTDAMANTGGGGGGGANNDGDGGYGGSGIGLISAPGIDVYNNMTLISNSTTAQAAPTKADVVLNYTDGAGTATINTDLIASVSRDNGTTYTTVTLASQGTTGGQTILTASNVDISGQPSGTSMVWKVATANQSATKDTRIHGVSLGWA